jgi:hypothetical protein
MHLTPHLLERTLGVALHVPQRLKNMNWHSLCQWREPLCAVGCGPFKSNSCSSESNLHNVANEGRSPAQKNRINDPHWCTHTSMSFCVQLAVDLLKITFSIQLVQPTYCSQWEQVTCSKEQDQQPSLVHRQWRCDQRVCWRLKTPLASLSIQRVFRPHHEEVESCGSFQKIRYYFIYSVWF